MQQSHVHGMPAVDHLLGLGVMSEDNGLTCAQQWASGSECGGGVQG